ncbi:MATE family efflux transporter [Granulosicoccus antarcticus]|uniref:Multidrug export protein MepA n=1 Tax=Granulosicoccus antarcticus IMCC3135 TaxID=1192854 RepID=A0A2Z2P1L8_9GAMM|nr:MATE family efflux transporter [Granulosicoccus antarcticus]ASJ74357.1 Multidrug export protein MepA [Granulosicoccus antarcticus IMCC3135]
MATHGVRYTEGSILGHVSTLSITSAIGLFAIFAVDLVDVFFIAMLGQPELAAAVGYAGTGLFFGAAICIGLSIATSTVVAQAMGAGQEQEAGRLATHGLLFSLALTLPLTLLALWFAPDLLALMGASGETLQLATHYFRIVGAALPIMGLGMAGTSLLRAVGEARLSMWATIIAGLVNAVLDPILIFGFGLDLTGAAIASVLSRFTVAGMALYYIIKRHQLIQRPAPSKLGHDARQLGSIAVPSLITNLAGPIGAAYATTQMSRFGTDAVAAAAVIGRITPVAFAGLYGLSGAVGPVASQNVGAGQTQRVSQTLKASALFVTLYVIPVAIVLFLARHFLVEVFVLQAEAAELLQFYCSFIVITYWLYGLQLAANPLFTALRHPGYATISNLFRDLCLGIPFIHLGSNWFGAPGVLGGQALGNMIAGIVAFSVALWLSSRLERGLSISLPFSFCNGKQRWNFYRSLAPGVQHRGH